MFLTAPVGIRVGSFESVGDFTGYNQGAERHDDLNGLLIAGRESLFCAITV
jgi:hypothetical protein